MAKTKRGRALWHLPSRGRGTCPICSSTRIKLLYTQYARNGRIKGKRYRVKIEDAAV